MLEMVYLRQLRQLNLRNYVSIFFLRWDVFKLIKNPFLVLTNFVLVMYKIAEKY